MHLRQSKQRRADGSTVSYLQLAENVWPPERRRSETHVVHNCRRADDRAVVGRLRKLAASIHAGLLLAGPVPRELDQRAA